MAHDGSTRPMAQSPAVVALKYDAGVGPEPHKVMMERSFSQDIQEGTQELKHAAEQTRNIILDLSLDGIIRWVSPSWTDVVGTDMESLKGQPVAQHVHDDPTVFEKAIEALKSNDSKSQFIKFTVLAKSSSALGPILDDVQLASPNKGKETDDDENEEEKQPLQLEGQGIMVYDRATGGESHTMWMLQPAIEPVQIEIELPQVLVDTLGIGAEILAKYLSELAESGANDPENHPPPLPILCRVCERSIVPWWFERHSDLCVQEHKAEMDVQMLQESLSEHRHAIVKVLDAFETRTSRAGSGDSTPVHTPPEYKGMPIGPSPTSSSAVSSRPGSQAVSPARSRSPSTVGQGHSRARSSFIVRRPLVRIVELILDLCDTAIEINMPAIKETKSDSEDEFRTQSPQSESRINQVFHWQQPSSLDNEPGLSALSQDTEKLARAKVEAVHRHQVILEYGERIRQEYLAEVDACISEALIKAERAAAGESISSSESESEIEEQMQDAEDDYSFSMDEPTPQALEPEPEMTRNQSRPHLRSMASALRDPMHIPPVSLNDSRRPSSQAVSTGSSSPQECPTPKSIKTTQVTQPQPISKIRSAYAVNDEAEYSDSSLPSSSVLSTQWRADSPASTSEHGLTRTTSSRDRKRRSMHLHGLSSSSPHRQQSPGRYPHAPASPLRMAKGRLPSVDANAQSPIVSPLLTSGDFPSSPQYHHRRQSSMHSSDARAPLSPKISSLTHPQPRAQPPSIKDFEIVKPISKGAFGSVYLSKKKLTGEYFAIKVLRKSDMVAKNQVTNVKAERAIMMWQGESDFVAKLYWTFSSKDYLFLVMEYLNGGDCASLIKILGGLTEDWAKKYVAEVVLGVEHLHSRGIVHRDLKPDNLLIDSKGHLKLTDFGLSRMGLIGRQKRALKSPDEPAPDLFKQGPFSSHASGPPSRSASFDFPPGNSPGQTPLMTPSLAGGLDQPSYFSLNRERSLSREVSRKPSGHQSDHVGFSSHDLHNAFQGLTMHDVGHSHKPLQSSHRHFQVEEESYSQGSNSPDLYPLSQSMSNISQHPSASTSQMLPPPTALFDPEEGTKRFVGTPDYLAPETITGTIQDEMCDWWSLGCILFEFLYGVPPFNAPTTEEVFDNILNRRIAWPDEEEFPATEEAKDLINKLIVVDTRQRLGANVNEKFKSGGAEIQAHPWFSEINWDTLLEDEAQFVPNPENPEDTEYFDARGATLGAFPEEIEEQLSPPGAIANPHDYSDRPHDALFRARTQAASAKRGLMPLHIPPHIARDSRSRRLSEPVIADDFGSFTFKNLPVLEKANKDIVEKMRKEAMQAQLRSSQVVSQAASVANTPAMHSPAQSVDGSPMIPMTVKRALSVSKHHRPASPSGFGGSGQTPVRGSQPASPLLVQFSTGQHHERRKTSGSSNSSSQHGAGQQEQVRDTSRGMSATSSPIKRMSSIAAPSPQKASIPSPGGRSRSQTVGSQDSEGQYMREPFVPGHHKRHSQLFGRDLSPSSSDNENAAHAKALLKVQRKRQSSRRMSQINLLDGPVYRPLDILICEDHPVSKMVMEKLFEKLRCRTITATTGPEALRLAVSQIQFDIIFTEFKLPLINGVDVARMIRDTKSANTQTPIVCMTGYLKDLPESHQFDTLLQKPPTVTKLTEALCKYCSWKPPPKDYKPQIPLTIPAPAIPPQHSQDSPSSVASSRAPTMPDSSYRGSSREDSVSSGGFFSDLESLRADDPPIIISRPATDEWPHGGLNIVGEPGVEDKFNATSSFPPLSQSESAPATAATEEFPPFSARTNPSQRSSEGIRSKRELTEKHRGSLGGAEEGDDEDEELGNQSRQRSPINRITRAASKLGQEMLRTNSRGSVISMNDDRPEPENLRRSLEILEERMEGLRIPEHDMDVLTAVQTRLPEPPTSYPYSHPGHERPTSRGHITPPEYFPPQPGGDVKEITVDNEATPMPNKTFDLTGEPTPRPQDRSS